MASGGEEDKINKQNGVFTAAPCISHFWGQVLVLMEVKKLLFIRRQQIKKEENGRENRKFCFCT